VVVVVVVTTTVVVTPPVVPPVPTVVTPPPVVVPVLCGEHKPSHVERPFTPAPDWTVRIDVTINALRPVNREQRSFC
jgi:hypothetical protein